MYIEYLKVADTLRYFSYRLYTEFNWTTPMEASLFSGDTAAPTGFDNGQLLISNRRQGVNSTAVWDHYYTTLSAAGYTLVSPVARGAEAFTAQYTKGQRNIIIYYFNTSNRSMSGSVLPSGHRLEIWYK